MLILSLHILHQNYSIGSKNNVCSLNSVYRDIDIEPRLLSRYVPTSLSRRPVAIASATRLDFLSSWQVVEALESMQTTRGSRFGRAYDGNASSPVRTRRSLLAERLRSRRDGQEKRSEDRRLGKRTKTRRKSRLRNPSNTAIERSPTIVVEQRCNNDDVDSLLFSSPMETQT